MPSSTASRGRGSLAQARVRAAGWALVGLYAAIAVAGEGQAYRIDIGSSGDERYVVDGFHAREGPNRKSAWRWLHTRRFRWTGNEFKLKLPVFPEAHNQITFSMMFRGGLLLRCGDWTGMIYGRGWSEEYRVVIPKSAIGRAQEIVLAGRATRPRRPGKRDKRILFVIVTDVTVRPTDVVPAPLQKEDLMQTCGDIPALDRIRGIERRPPNGDPQAFVEQLLMERANAVTIGAMVGQGVVFYPSKLAPAHPGMDPDWLPGVTKELRAKGLKILCWVCFNVQDTRRVADFRPAQDHPEWRMQFIDDGREWPDRVGMCLLSSPYIEHHGKVLQEMAAFDFDGFFFDGFYLSGVPHPSRPGCVCPYCQKAFKEDSGFDLPKREDWADAAFKRWVRWRNHRLLKTARYFQQQVRKVNPNVTCTFNYNMWPFARKDWETGIPAWRIDDFGVSQHGYSGRSTEKWLLTGFKARLGRDINPAHTDMWRACGFAHTCGRGKEDLPWHEHEIKAFLLTGLAHGITPWHSTIAGPVELSARIHGEVAKRERYFSRDYVANVAVVYSQNAHDFYGHLPGTDNLSRYRDGILGAWMLLSERHVPFEFIFDNQLEASQLARYDVVVLANSACLSKAAVDQLARWVRAGGRLLATADTGLYDEWGDRAEGPRLGAAFALDFGAGRVTKSVAGGQVTYWPDDPGLSYCRARDRAAGEAWVEVIRATPMPFAVEAPDTLVVNLFRSPDKAEYWVHLLNVSAFMPNGDSGFRGLDQPPAQIEDVASDAELAGKSGHVRLRHVPARNVVFRLTQGGVSSARLVVAGQQLTVAADGSVAIPEVDLHDVLVLR